MKKFEHYILCRYNYHLYISNPYNIKDKDGWMNERLELFSKLLISLNNQTNKNFKFIIFIDAITPDIHKKNLKNLLDNNIKNIHFEICEISIQDFFSNLKDNTEFVITSRIDNDDEYLPNFVEYIQKSFNNTEEVLDVHGCQFDLRTGKKYTSGRTQVGSPFISLVEKTNNCKSVFQKQHDILCKNFSFRFVNTKEFLYIQNIHDKNLANKIRGTVIN